MRLFFCAAPPFEVIPTKTIRYRAIFIISKPFPFVFTVSLSILHGVLLIKRAICIVALSTPNNSGEEKTSALTCCIFFARYLFTRVFAVAARPLSTIYGIQTGPTCFLELKCIAESLGFIL